MKEAARLIIFIGVAVLLTAPLKAIAQPHVSVWTTIDPNDGSRAYIGVNAAWQIVFYDTDATFGCRSGGGGPFFGFDDNNGNTVTLNGNVLVGHLEGICRNGGPGQNISFDLGMGYFPDSDTVRSRNTNWDRTFIDPEEFVADAFEVKRLSPLTARSGIWEFMGSHAGDDLQIIPGDDCIDESVNSARIEDGGDWRACDFQFKTIDAGYEAIAVGNINLRSANGSGASITAFVNNSDMTGIQLQGAYLRGSFTDIGMRYANLSFSRFSPTPFSVTEFRMHSVDLYGADLRGIEFAHFYPIVAELRYVNFRNADLEGARFTWTQLRNPDFSNANLLGVVFIQSSVTNAVYSNTICPDGTNSDDNGGHCTL